MRVKVLKDFIDKNTGKLYTFGEEIEVNKKRFEELRAAGKYVAEVKDAKEEKTEEKVEESVQEEATEEAE